MAGGAPDDDAAPDAAAVRRLGGGVARAAGGAVKGTVRGTIGVGAGARCVVSGVLRLIRTPWLWPYGIAPVAIAIVVFVGVTYGMVDWLVPSARALAAEYTGEWGGVAATILSFAVLVAAALLTFYVAFPSIVRVFAAPFMALLVDRVYAEVAGHETPPLPGGRVVRWVLRPIYEALALLVVRLVVTVIALPLICVPVVGAALFFAVLLPIEGMDLLDLAQSARGVPLRERLRFVRRHLAASSGLGLGAAGLLLVPVLNVFFLPALVVGAVLLDQRISPDFAGPVDGLPGPATEGAP